MGYTEYVNLVHYIVAFTTSLFAIYFTVNVLFRKNVLKNSVNLSPTITVYFGFVFLCAISSIEYLGYLIIFWRPDGRDYNAFLLYIGGIFPGLFLNTSSIVETFLCIERCTSLLFPLKYSQKLKFCFAILSFFGIISAMAFSLVTKYVEVIPATSETLCQSVICIAGPSLAQSLFAQKAVLSIVNIIFALILAYLIKKTIINSKSAAQMNKTVFILLISTAFIALIPFLSAYIFNVITGDQLFAYIGPFGSSSVIFNVTLSVALYYKAFKKFTNNNNNIKIIGTAVPTATSSHLLLFFSDLTQVGK